MKNVLWSFYHQSTGVISARRFVGPALSIEKNTPAEHVAIAGHYDRRAQRVDVATGTVVPYQAPADELGDRAREQRRIHARIAAIEQRQARSVRELQIDPTNDAARTRLRRIEEEIVVLRAGLAASAGSDGR